MGQSENTARVKIGVNLVVVRAGKVLLGKRKNIFGAGTWGLPGGKLDQGEMIWAAAKWELREETGLKIEQAHLMNVVHQFQGKQQWLQFGFVVEKFKGGVINAEPEFCEEWRWCEGDKLPEKIFKPHGEHLRQYLKYEQILTEEVLE